MFRKSLDLWLAVALAVGAIALALCGVSGPVLAVCGALLVFFLPGYTLLRAVGSFAVGRAESWLLSFGLSLLLTLAGGIILNLLPLGLQPGSWAIWLGDMTLLFAGLALARPADLGQKAFNFSKLAFKPVSVALVTVAVVVAVAAFMVARAGAAEPTGSFTQLWLLPYSSATPSASASTTTTTSALDSQVVRLGISNQESTTVTYRLVLTAGDKVVQEWPSLALAAGQEWKTVLTLPAGTTGVQATLYRQDQPNSIYRQVYFAAASPVSATAKP